VWGEDIPEVTENLRSVAVGVVVNVSEVVVVLLEFAVDVVFGTTNLLVWPIYEFVYERRHKINLR
jgi:hypothetical protein